MMRKKIIIIGAGFTGCVIARELAELDYKVDIIDVRNHIGGNAYDYFNSYGENVHKYGPHLFHTNNDRIGLYMRDVICKGNIIEYKHRVMAKIDYDIIDKYGLNLYEYLPIGPTILSKIGSIAVREIFYRPYTEKMWNKKLEELDPAIMNRVKIAEEDTEFYFKDKWQFLPKNGYTKALNDLIDHPNINLTLSTKIKFDPTMRSRDVFVFNCSPIDEWFNYIYGELNYRSIIFSTQKSNLLDSYPDVATINFTSQKNTKNTRFTIWNRLPTSNRSNIGEITFETPCDYLDNNRERFYPVKDLNGENRKLYHKYEEMANSNFSNMKFVGRCGRYQYIDMDQAIGQALAIIKQFREEEDEKFKRNYYNFTSPVAETT